VAVTKNAVWAVDSGQLLRIDPTSGAITATIALPGAAGHQPLFVTAGPSGVWLSNPYDNSIVHVDETTNTATVVAHTTGRAGPLDQSPDTVWVANETLLTALDPANGTERSTIELHSRILSLAVDRNGLWVATDAGITRVDPSTGAVTPVTVPAAAHITLVATDYAASASWAAADHPPSLSPLTPPVPTPAAPLPQCRSDQLATRLLGIQGAAGHLVASYWIGDTSADPCELASNATIELLDSNGDVVATIASSGANPPPRLNPNTDPNTGNATPLPGIANINLWWSPLDLASGGGACSQPTLQPTAVRMRIGAATLTTTQVSTDQFRIALCGNDTAAATGPSQY
jgi:hypothetical protein